jgi:hypothetical protein
VLRAPPNLPQSTPIDVTYEYQRNGCLKVRARLTSDPPREITIELEREKGLSDEAIGRWKRIVAGNQPGFDPFDAMLDDVVAMSEAQRDATVAAQMPRQPRRDISDLLPQPALPMAQTVGAPLAVPVGMPFAGSPFAPRPQTQVPLGQAILAQPVGDPSVQAAELLDEPSGSGKRILLLGFGLIAASTIGLLAGYYILSLVTHWNPLHLRLPGLVPAQRAPLDPDQTGDAEK